MSHVIVPGPSFPMRLNVNGFTWGPYESYWRQRHSESLLHDAEFRARNPGMARSFRVALVSQLDHLDPALGELSGATAVRAERERARTARIIYGGGYMPAIEILDGGFPAPGLANIAARARLQAHRDAGATHAYVRFDFTGPPLWELLSKPPWTSSAPPVVRRGRPLRPRVPVWIR